MNREIWQKCVERAAAMVAAYRAQLPAGFDPQNTVVSGTTNAVLAAEAQKDANRVNRNNARDTNALNQYMFDRARGSAGSAVMPTYMKTTAGQPWEGMVLAPQLRRLFDDTTPRGLLKRLEELKASYMPMQAAAAGKAGDIFDGDIERTLLGNYEPVASARAELGTKRTAFRRQSSIDALNKRLANIDAVQAGKGYSGDSLSQRMMTFAAEKQSSDDASEGALMEYADRLQTAMERKAIQDYAGVQLPLSSLNLPAELMAQAMGLETMPGRELLDYTSARLQPLTFMRIGQGQPFQHSPMPLVNPVSSPWQLMAQGTAQTGNMAADYWMKQQQAKQWQAQQYQARYGTGAIPGAGGQAYVPMTGNAGRYYAPYGGGGAAGAGGAAAWSDADYAAWDEG